MHEVKQLRKLGSPAHGHGPPAITHRFTTVGALRGRRRSGLLRNPGTRTPLGEKQTITIRNVNGVDAEWCLGYWNGSQDWQELPEGDPLPVLPAAAS
jgi:hypothetical protein